MLPVSCSLQSYLLQFPPCSKNSKFESINRRAHWLVRALMIQSLPPSLQLQWFFLSILGDASYPKPKRQSVKPQSELVASCSNGSQPILPLGHWSICQDFSFCGTEDRAQDLVQSQQAILLPRITSPRSLLGPGLVTLLITSSHCEGCLSDSKDENWMDSIHERKRCHCGLQVSPTCDP